MTAILIAGESASGKSSSLARLEDKTLHINTENGKELPFDPKINPNLVTVTANSIQKFEAILRKVITSTDIKNVVIDTLDFLLDMHETQVVYASSNSKMAWRFYSEFFKEKIMNDCVAEYPEKNWIFLAHTIDTERDDGSNSTQVPAKGSMRGQIESRFMHVISCQLKSLGSLEGFENPMLNITEEEEQIECKHVFQTRPTKTTLHYCIKSPMGLWTPEETYIDNNLQFVIDRIHPKTK